MKYLVPVCVAAALLSACGKKQEVPPPSTDQATATPAAPPVAPPEPAVTAAAQLAATKGNQASGTIAVAPMGDGVHLTGTLTGLKPDSEFGFHIHEKGDCSAPDASSAGGHFNPAGVEHGPQDGTHHAGDLSNAKSDAQGNVEVNAHVSGVSLGDGGANDVLGKAIVLHEKADDYKSQPAGNSGARIACGVIAASGM
jgi:superoxide dismutase, Cu-Zn family